VLHSVADKHSTSIPNVASHSRSIRKQLHENQRVVADLCCAICVPACCHLTHQTGCRSGQPDQLTLCARNALHVPDYQQLFSFSLNESDRAATQELRTQASSPRGTATRRSVEWAGCG
jgi:hypothetical protein